MPEAHAVRINKGDWKSSFFMGSRPKSVIKARSRSKTPLNRSNPTSIRKGGVLQSLFWNR